MSQPADTLNGYHQKITGEDINYFSPKLEFAKTALLTRCNGESAIEWQAPVSKTKTGLITYKLLMGHSTGTSKANRHFDVLLNDILLFTIQTPMHKKNAFEIKATTENGSTFYFRKEILDANDDAFGTAYITVPAMLVTGNANFKIKGKNENSRDWLMIFQYSEKADAIVMVQSLIRRNDSTRELTVLVDNPFADGTMLKIMSKHFEQTRQIKNGYNRLSISSYPKDFIGKDTLTILLNHVEMKRTVECFPVKDFTFYIIHHSHNDIGYSHIQTEVEQIQNNNITDALNWIKNNRSTSEKPIWHIESLWAVENFYKIATPQQTLDFKQAVKKGNIILSANYINILTGLCSEYELNWLTEYARMIEPELTTINSSMVTDIPGITASGLRTQLNNGVKYLSFGPNYIETFPDRGDRVGSLIDEQGDKVFYWKNKPTDKGKLMVWTAGKGYSYFHGIADDDKQKQWENRISAYCNELYNKNYPYDMVQLRYTKRSDNGPVDTTLCTFADNWNKLYQSPTLKIASVPALFEAFEKKYGSTLKELTGEISPYWEDGAYSTAAEEAANRELSQKTVALEKYARKKNLYNNYKTEFYQLHRNIIMFHEHTWGAWCSISDPESHFTTEQWQIKKAFLDSGLVQYQSLAKQLGFKYQYSNTAISSSQKINSFTVDEKTGGLKEIMLNGKNIVPQNGSYRFFEPVYVTGSTNPAFAEIKNVKVTAGKQTAQLAETTVQLELNNFTDFNITYQLNKLTGALVCRAQFKKQIEKNKESLHFAFPFNTDNANVSYNSGIEQITINRDQLPGSNKDFICTEGELLIRSKNYALKINSPSYNIFELDNIINEVPVNGAKKWKTKTGDLSTLFLYVLNNYWHTNFKAWQDGSFNVEITLQAVD
ncbi:MAG TPA: hypothetical protein PKN75_11860 [Bacteroidia bacterium]|nr:hypothetical protein [Bacteroidia bacterium]